MKISIGGLFKQIGQADQARNTLQQAGFNAEELKLWVHKQHVPLNEDHRVSPLEIGLSALLGAVIAGVITAIIGALIGIGEVRFPGVRPDFARGPFIEMMGFFQFVVSGALAGAILGAASRLLTSRENARITSTGIHRGGVLLVVNADDSQKEMVSRILQENDALDIQNLTEKWDAKVWDGFKETQPPVTS
jgi:hypothetical protein